MRFWSVAFGTALVALPLLLTGCSTAADRNDEPLGSAEEPIVGGYSDSADTSIVAVVDTGLGALCSGSLIAPNVVLTARHCVAPVLDEDAGAVDCSTAQFGANKAVSSFDVSTHAVLDMNPSSYHAVTQIATPPASADLCGSDLAILFLAASIDPTEAVPRTPRVDSSVNKGDAYSAIGYGGTDSAGTGVGQRRRRDDLHVMCVDDCPSEEATAKELVGDTGICEGDSGGPAIDLEGRVVGVGSRGAASCTSPVYGSVYAWASWIAATTIAGAKLGGVASPAWTMGAPTDPEYTDPVGGACTQSSDCASGHCARDSSGLYCTRFCDKAACPDGYECDTTSAPALCERTPTSTLDPTASCSIAVRGADPTKPIPWFTGAVALAALGLIRHRRG